MVTTLGVSVRVFAAAVLAASVAVSTGCAATPPPVSDQVQKYYDQNVVGAKAGPVSSKPAGVVVSVLSDSHAYNADSWFRQTVEAETVPGVRFGAFASQPGAAASVLSTNLDAATAHEGIVIVQAGTNDLVSAVGPEGTAANVEALVTGVKGRGVTPVLALIPPSNTHGLQVLETNKLLAAYAKEKKIGLLDVTSPVIGPEGQWKDGLSNDGTHANKAGSKLMADAAAKQLPALIR